MFRWLLGSKKKLTPLDFSILKTDIHSHLIPGIDDGSPDMKTTISLIQSMQEMGFNKLITTPHIMSDCYKNTSQDILSGLEDVRKELNSQDIDIDVHAAAEYYIDFSFEQRIGKEKFLTFGSNYILVELSFVEEPRNLFEIIFKLQLEGYKVVLAHPERYMFYTLEDYKELKNRGVFLQINLLSLIGYYSLEIQKKTEKLIEAGLVSFVGSDCHNMHHAELYEKCQSNRLWHDLVNRGTLLNQDL